jgi:hypothetical protein
MSRVRHYAEFLAELDHGSLEQIFARLRLAFWDCPETGIPFRKEWAARMNEQNFDITGMPAIQ